MAACLLVVLGGLGSVSAQEIPTDFDFTSLAHPEIAEFLQLEDSQRTQIATLVAEQASKVATVAEGERPAVIQEYAEKIKGVLTAPQLARLKEIPELRPLEFNFGSQNWEDVLRWFAKQADLSLVMSSAPAGNFNYVDTNRYTPAQAINLLNSILLTKGYTLVRRDKLLILVELSGGIPDELLPRVTLDELNQRGSFEIVSVMFSLGDKPPDKVMAEVKPLLGSYGKMALLPQSNQLLVTETVGKIKAINTLVESIPSPAPPPQPPKPENAPPPELKSYPLGGLDFEATSTVIKAIAPNLVISGGPASQKIIAYGPPAQQELLQKLLEQLNSGTPPQEQNPHLKVYQVEKPVEPKLIGEQLALVVPTAKVAVAEDGLRILVYATDVQQAQVAQTLEQMNILTTTTGSGAEVRLFPLRRADPAVAAQMAQAVSPQAKVTLDAPTRTLVVRADPAELAIVAQLVDQLDSNSAQPAGLVLKSYDWARGAPAEWMTVLQSTAPQAKLQVDERAGKIMVIADEADQQRLAGLIAQYQAARAGNQPSRLVTYEVLPALKTQFLAMQKSLPTEFGAIQVIPDEQPNRLTIWGDAAQHEQVAAMLEQLRTHLADPGSFTFKSYETTVADLPGLIALLQPKFPEAKLTANTAGDRLMVWAAAPEHEALATQLAALSAELPQRQLAFYETYPLVGADPTTAIPLLQPLAPNAKLSADAGQERLVVWGTALEHQALREAVEKLYGAGAGRGPQLVAVPLADLDPTTATTLLKTLVPRAAVTVDPAGQQLLVIASEADQAAAQKVLTQLRGGLQQKDEPTIKFYPLAASQATTATDLLTQLVPAAKVKYDAAGRQLSAIATLRDHARIAKALGDLTAGMTPPTPPKLVVYPLPADLRPRLQAVLAAAAAELGEIKIVEDQRPGEFAVLATPPQHEMLAKIISEVGEPIAGVEAFVLKAYGVGSGEPAQVVQFLTPLFPAAKIVADDSGMRVLIWAQPAIHQEVERVLQEFAPADEQPGTNAQALRSYKLTNLKPTAAITLLQQLLPRVQMVGNDEQGVLLAWGRERDHAKLKAAVEQLALPDDPKRLSVQVYRTENVDPQIAAVVVGRILPDAIAVPNAAGRILAVLARQDQQALVREALDQMGQFNLASGPLAAQVYRVERTGSTAVVAALTPIFPQAKLFAGATTSQVVALANAADHEQIRQTIDRLESESATQGITLRVYHLRPELAAQVRPLIASALPTLKTLGSDPAVLAVFGKNDEQAVVQQLIEQAEQQLVASPKALQAYPLKQLAATQVRTALTQKIPGLSFVELGGDPQVLYVLGTSEEHVAAAKLLDELSVAFVQKPAAVVATYPVPDVDLTQLVGLLPADLTAQATIKTDPLNKLLIVSGPETIQTRLQTAIAELQEKLPKLDQPVPRIYPLSGIRPADWTALLAAVAPGAVTAADPNSGSLVVVGNRQTHEALERLITGIVTATQAGKVARPYRISKADVTVASAAITALVPQAEVSVDKASRTLIVVAKDEDQQRVAQALQEIDLHAPNAARSQVYAVPSGDATALATALKSLIPSATYVADSNGKALLVLATDDEHQQLKTTIDQWASDPARVVAAKVYPLKKADPTASLPVLQKLIPGATLSADPAARAIAATATAEQHRLLATAIDELDSLPGSIETKVYPLGGLTAKDWQALLAQLAPGTVAAGDPASNSLVVAGNSETHAKIAQLLNEFKTLATQGKVARSYRVSRADVTVASEAVSALIPQAKITVDKTGRSLIVVGTEEDQTVAAATLEQIDLHAPGAAVAKVYAVSTGEGAELAIALKALVPTATFVADKQGKSLLALASPDEQTQIQTAVAEWTSDPARVLTTKVYKLAVADPAAALPVLQKLLPGATFSADAATRAIAATATAEQHQSIAAAVHELDSASEPAETRIYPAGGLGAKDWQALLAQLAPGAVAAVEPDSGSLVVLARPQIHQQITQLVEQFRTSLSADKSIRAYRLTQADPQTIADSITALVPLARVTVDKGTRTIIVVAGENDQQTVESVVTQVDREMVGAAISKIYPVATGDAAALATALKSLVPTGTFVADPTGKSLLAIASPTDQQILGTTVAAWSGDGSRALRTQVYHLQQADPTTSLAALQKLIPGATLAADANTRALLATATAEQHELLRQAVEQLDGGEAGGGETTLQAYSVRRVPADSLAKALSDLFKKDTQVSVVADKESNALIVIARRKQHEMIAAMVAASSQALSNTNSQQQIQMYPLANTDGKALVATLQKMFLKDHPAPEISYDEQGQQLFVMGTPEQQEVVRQLAVRITGEAQEFEMFRLQHIDPFTAESAINGLFKQESRSTAPSVQVDFDNSYLFVRASAAQMERIKALLTKLGEENLNEVASDRQRMRVISLGTDTEPVLEQLQKMWPQLQSNELRIVAPPPESERKLPSLDRPLREERTPPPRNEPQSRRSVRPAAALQFVAYRAVVQEPTAPPPQEPPAAEPAAAQDKPPIFVIPGPRQLTIASTDPAAIEQLEELIRTISGPLAESRTSGNFEAFPLKNAGASEVAAILNDLYKGIGEDKRDFGPPVVIAADDRLNMVIVHGSRSDRETLGKLTTVLDSPDLTDAYSINQPVIVPVKNTDAERILTILNSVYRSQLSSGGGRRQLPIPEGVSTEMAVMLQQINAATSGPILTLGVDIITNSIIVLAPQQLRDQVRATIEQLDRNVEVEPGEKIEIIQLKKTNPARIQRALNLLFNENKK